MRIAWLLVVAAGCGRVDFDPQIGDAGSGGPRLCTDDMKLGHDEDIDYVDDNCDVCPHIPDPAQPDMDGDGVGDACDPNPTTPGDSIRFFDGFGGGLAVDWDAGGAVGFPGTDTVRFDTTTEPVYLRLRKPPRNDTYVLAVHVTSEGPGGHQLTIAGRDTGSAFYYCEILDGVSEAKVAMTYTLDGVSYMVNEAQPISAPVVGGDLTLAMHVVGNDVTCSTTWPPAPTARGANPGIVPAALDLFITGSVIELRYFLDIASP